MRNLFKNHRNSASYRGRDLFFLYRTAKDEAGKKGAFLLTIFHMNFLPKWVAMPEFELIHYWGMLMTFLLFYPFERSGGVYRFDSCRYGICDIRFVLSDNDFPVSHVPDRADYFKQQELCSFRLHPFISAFLFCCSAVCLQEG